MSKQKKPPRIAISYSHQPPEHAERVRAVAQRLASDGVEVEMDIWSVREGHDLNVFMESMVTDKTINKVLIFSNRSYTEKADARDRGVGTEAQILSAEIYGKAKQDKFIPIVCEYDGSGKAYLPVFLRGRLYIDFSSPEGETENYERLLRRIFEKPERTKPAAGTPPAYIMEGTLPANPLAAKLRSYRDALVAGKTNTRLLLEDFLSAFFATVRQQRIQEDQGEPFDETLLRSLEAMKPLRDNFVEACELWIHSTDAPSFPQRITRLFEELRGLGEWPEDTNSWNEVWGENFRLFVHELFLYAVALLLRHHEFTLLSGILITHFVLPPSAQPRDIKGGAFTILCAGSDALAARNQRLKANRLNPFADVLKQRATIQAIPFAWLQQADLVLFVCSLILHREETPWHPDTLVFTLNQFGAFEIFLRAESRAFYQKVAVLWGGLDPNAFRKTVTEQFKTTGIDQWRFGLGRPNWEKWLNWEKLGSRP